jgi:hypothetical protein
VPRFPTFAVLNIVPGSDDAGAADDEVEDVEEAGAMEPDADVLDELLQAAPSSAKPASATITVNRREDIRCRI